MMMLVLLIMPVIMIINVSVCYSIIIGFSLLIYLLAKKQIIPVQRTSDPTVTMIMISH